MTKYNRNFAKPAADMTPLFCPIPLRVVIHHHEEWDEPVLDPETREPTGETERKTRDWDEAKTVLRPSDADKKLAGYLPLSPDWPVDPAPDGQHWERTDKIEPNGADGYRWTYRLVDDPPPPPKVYSVNWLIYALMERDVYDQCRQWMEQAGLRDLVLTQGTFTADTEKFDEIKNGLQALLGYTDEQVAEILAEAEVG